LTQGRSGASFRPPLDPPSASHHQTAKLAINRVLFLPHLNPASLNEYRDPTDILKPEGYEIDNPAWADPRKENKRAMREFCN